MSDIEILKIKLAEWKYLLGQNDIHTIGAQIAQLLWRSAFYRSLNESRRFLPDEVGGRKQANGPLHELIDDGYFVINSAAIRRLLDKGATTGRKGVCSLHGLVRDIQKHANIVTRANMLSARGLQYEFEPIKRRAYDGARQDAREKGITAYFIPRDGWSEAEYWHKAMDKLCQIPPTSRRVDDTPDQQKLLWLLWELETQGSNVQSWVDKFVAHAASIESRNTLHAEHRSLSLAKLWRAERAVVRTASFISHYFVDGMNIGGVPISEFDQFAHLSDPFIQPSALPAMQDAWSQHRSDISSCQNWFWDLPLADASDVWNDEAD